MSKSKPPTMSWVETLGPLVANKLSEKHRRKFLYQQAGPYNNSTGIFFYEQEIRDIKSPVATDRAGFRCGFVVWRIEDPFAKRWMFSAGFETWNKAIARVRFQQNVRNNAELIARELLNWLNPEGSGLRVEFDMEADREFTWDRSIGVVPFASALRQYGDLDRPGTGKNKHEPGGWVGSSFGVYAKYLVGQGSSESDPGKDHEFTKGVSALAAGVLDVYADLSFLYSLLHKDPVIEPVSGLPSSLLPEEILVPLVSLKEQ